MRWFLSLMLFALFGCSSPSEPPFGPTEPILGTTLAPNVWAISPAWSTDAREVLFLEGGAGGYVLRSVSTASLQIRSISEPLPVANSGRNDIGVASAIHTPFFSGTAPNTGLNDHLYRVTAVGTTPELVLDDMEWPWFSVSADGRRVAYSRTSEDGTQAGVTLVVRDLDLGIEGIARTGWDPSRAPFSLSPDGEWLVFTSAPPHRSEAVMLFSFESGSSIEIWPGTDDDDQRRIWSHDVLWEGDTPHLVLVEQEGERLFSVRRMNGRTGVVTTLAQLPDAEDFPYAVSWSHDGAKVALWTPIETGPWSCTDSGCISRKVIHWRLYVWTDGEGWSTVAEVAVDEGVRWLSFSPDASSIGYQLYGQMYVGHLD